jgi:hypothetical protein
VHEEEEEEGEEEAAVAVAVVVVVVEAVHERVPVSKCSKTTSVRKRLTKLLKL